MNWIKKILFGINILVVIPLLISYLAPFANPQSLGMVSFIGLFFPVWLFINILFFLFWLFASWKKAWLSLVVLLLGWWFYKGIFGFDECVDTAMPAVKVMSYNLYGLKKLRKLPDSEKTKHKEELGWLIESRNPDVFIVQENNAFSDKSIEELIHFENKFRLASKATTIYSNSPILRQGEIDFGTNTNSCLWIEVEYHGRRVRVYNVHFQSNLVSEDAGELLDAQSSNANRWSRLFEMLKKYNRAAKIRVSQAKLVNEHIAECPYPVILAGDFNDTPMSYLVHRFKKKLQDCFAHCGYGFGTSFAGSLPWLRIDYIFVSDDFIPGDYETIIAPYSDHFPIFCEVHFARK